MSTLVGKHGYIYVGQLLVRFNDFQKAYTTVPVEKPATLASSEHGDGTQLTSKDRGCSHTCTPAPQTAVVQ